MSFFGGGPKAPATPPAPPTLADPSVIAAQQAQAAAAAQAMGRGSTILTSGQGVTTTPTVAKSTILGG